MGRQKKSLLGTMKRGLSSLFVFSIAVLPIAMTVHMFDPFHNDAKVSDNRKVAALPAFGHRAQDVSTPRLFEEPIVTVTFDDGWESIYVDAVPLLQKYGIRSTQYVLSGTGNDINYMSDKQILSMHQAGQEIGCHTIDHKNLTTLDDKAVERELKGCSDYYSKLIGKPINDFASPYGAYTNHSLDLISKFYRSQRNTDADITNGNTDADVNLRQGFNRYNIISFAVRADTTPAQIKAVVDYTIANNGWLVLTYHQLEDGVSNAPTFGIDTIGLEKQFSIIASSPVRIASMGDVLDTIAPTTQKVSY